MKPLAAAAARLSVLFAVSLAGAPVTFAQTPAKPRLGDLSKDFQNLARRVSPAVVHIVSSGYTPSMNAGGATALTRQVSGGSGMIIDPSGYILTNHHVIEGARRVQVLLADRRRGPADARSILRAEPRLRDAEVAGVDDETDLALLKIDDGALPTLKFADSDELSPGELVFAFGSPLGLENSVTMGIVSSVARQLEEDSPMIYIQTDTAINPGNSGGPLVNVDGEIVGVNTLIFSQSGGNEGIGFAAPSNIAKYVAKQIRENGGVIRGEIGVVAQSITPTIVAGLGLKRDWGVILSDVVPDGPAYIGGLRAGDVVLSLDRKPMENARQFQVNLYSRRIGDVVEIRVLRGDQVREFRVAVLERENDTGRLAKLVSEEKNWVRKLGVLALTLNPELARMIPMLRKPSGVVVAARAAEGPYWSAAFQPGDIIYEVNGQAVSTLTELRQALAAIEPGGPAVFQLQRGSSTRYLPLELE